MEFFSRSFKLRTGTGLVIVAGSAILWWFVSAVKSGSPWSSSPFLWFLTLTGFFVGMSMIASTRPLEKNKPLARKRKNQVMLVYLILSIGLSLIFLIAHVSLNKKLLPAGQTYLPWMILLSLISYTVCYWWLVREADYRDYNPLTVPVLFMMGIAIAPLAAINSYNESYQSVPVLTSTRDIFTTRSNLVKFEKIKLKLGETLTWTREWTGEDEDFHADYYGLIPVFIDSASSWNTVWIDFRFTQELKKMTSPEDRNVLIKAFYRNCEAKVNAFDPDSVVVYDQSLQRGMPALDENNYPVSVDTVFLQPLYEEQSPLFADSLFSTIGLYVLISTFFWAAASGRFERY